MDYDPAMDARVSALEVGFQEMKGSLHRLELAFVRIESVLSNVATKADVAALSEKVSVQGDRLTKVEAALSNVATKADVAALSERASAQGDRLTKVEEAIDETIKTALSKTIGPWQVPGILAVRVALIGVLMAALNWAGHQPWFPH